MFFQNYPYNQIAQWVFAAIQPEGKNEIIFSEFVHMVAFFVMLAQKELMKFLFHAVDTDNKQYLRYFLSVLLLTLWVTCCFASVSNYELSYFLRTERINTTI